MNQYQIEVEFKRGKEVICIYSTQCANTETEARELAAKEANAIGYFGKMKMKVFGGHPAQDHSSLVF